MKKLVALSLAVLVFSAAITVSTAFAQTASPSASPSVSPSASPTPFGSGGGATPDAAPNTGLGGL